jgi:hypothetical protein
MDFNKLIEPYSENGRTISGQIKWLLKNGLPQDAIDYSMTVVYKNIESGHFFNDGHDLDQELLKVAKEHYAADLEESMKKRIGAISTQLDSDWNKLSKTQKIMQVITGKA